MFVGIFQRDGTQIHLQDLVLFISWKYQIKATKYVTFGAFLGFGCLDIQDVTSGTSGRTVQFQIDEFCKLLKRDSQLVSYSLFRS